MDETVQGIIADGNARGLIEFFNFAAARGMINKNTAGALRSGVQVVLSAAEPDRWQTLPLAEIDLEDVAGRFEKLAAGRFKPDSLVTYKSRFRNGVAMYLEYLANPSGWRFRAERPYRQRQQKAAARRATGTVTPARGGGLFAPRDEVDLGRNGTYPEVIEYPYPLRAGLIIKLSLPVDLTKDEATRLSKYLEALAVEQADRLTAPSAGVAAEASA